MTSSTISFKNCERFKLPGTKNADLKNAIVYMKLKNSGCPRKKAVKFSSKNICKVDTTKQYVGPKNFRILKIKTNPITTLQVS